MLSQNAASKRFRFYCLVALGGLSLATVVLLTLNPRTAVRLKNSFFSLPNAQESQDEASWEDDNAVTDSDSHDPSHAGGDAFQSSEQLSQDNEKLGHRLHVLLPATQGDVDLCKTLLTAKALGYPTPGLIAWDEKYDNPAQMAGGSHLAKVFRTLEYLELLPPSRNSDLVMMMDAYDIWFQLKPEILIHRFHTINTAANDRIRHRMGRLADNNAIEQKIIFGAGKRCAPNQLHTVACYPIPQSPLPADLYGDNTDTVIGRNKYTSLRQRYLNSGYVLGTVKDLRALLRAAAKEIENTPDHIPELDNGSGGSDYLYHGSDQSIFNTLLGKQEYRREFLRQTRERRRSSVSSQNKSRRGALQQDQGGNSRLSDYKYSAAHNVDFSDDEAPDLALEGINYRNPLKPPFTHEEVGPITEEATRHWELGIGLDYFSELGHQTVNAKYDAKWMSFAAQPLDLDFPEKNAFDCRPHVDRASTLADIAANGSTPFPVDDMAPPQTPNDWHHVPLYTNLCTGKVPVMIHHNGDKDARGSEWKELWLQEEARKMMEYQFLREEKSVQGAGTTTSTLDKTSESPKESVIAWTDKGSELSWKELCGAYDPSIFE
ncbi:MAG: hypothetical protein Q9227_003665 [Pyrenula ochraceoflavens]